MFVSERTLADLGFAHVLRALAERCRTDMGRERARARPFLASRAEIEAALQTVTEARALAEDRISLPLGGLADVRPSLERAQKRAMLEPRELSAIAQLLAASLSTMELLANRPAPQLAARVARLPSQPRLTDRLEAAFEPSGELSDQASPELKTARERARGLHRSIKTRLDELLRNEQFAANLREGYYSVRNDRYVIPVLASARAQVPGIVHNASQSGQTLFVEPQEMIGLGNDLAIAQSLVVEEERRILQELSEQVGERAPEIAEGVVAIAELDEAGAAARLSIDLGASVPSLEAADGALELAQLRHPLLVLGGAQVVPNDLKLAPPLRALIVSGPNAGGKTVTLTAVGLCAAMLRAGLPIPAGRDSRLPLFESVHAAVGDAQDLDKGLSTFSAHVVQLRDIDATVGPGSLVLVDEIAADTDPREGAALAVAVLEDLLGRGAVALVTTHLEEVKALAHLDARFQNARVGFDTSRMAPTYRLQLGLAGQSSAIEIAGRMGLPERICSRARELAQSSGGPLAKALAAAEADRAKLAEERARAEEAAREAEAARLAGERTMAERLAEQRVTLKKELDAAAEQMRRMIAELREKPTLKAISRARERVLDQAEKLEAPVEATVPLSVGGMARYRKLKQAVEIIELGPDQALVSAGAMKMRVPLDELSGIPGAKPPPAKAPRQVPDEELPATCDIRGLRAEDALREVERFMDRAVRQGAENAVILHGHGTGALKLAVRTFLDESPYVRMFRPGQDHEGGDGVTVVAFRG